MIQILDVSWKLQIFHFTSRISGIYSNSSNYRLYHLIALEKSFQMRYNKLYFEALDLVRRTKTTKIRDFHFAVTWRHDDVTWPHLWRHKMIGQLMPFDISHQTWKTVEYWWSYTFFSKRCLVKDRPWLRTQFLTLTSMCLRVVALTIDFMVRIIPLNP